jgi:uncharacterized membrane protein YwaF
VAVASAPSSDHLGLFGGDHLAALAVIAIAAAALTTMLRRVAGRPCECFCRRTVCWSLAVIVAASQVAEQIGLIGSGTWTVQESLPLHLCDLAVPVVVLALVCVAEAPYLAGTPLRPSRNNTERWGQTLCELAYFWGLGGTVQALLTPDIDDPFPSPEYIRYFTGHGGIVVSVLVLTIGLKIRPRRGSVLRVWLITNALALAVMAFNAGTGSNYMYLCGPPSHPSLFDYFGPWPWSLITLEVVGIVILALCYAPFWLTRRRGQ